MANVDDEVDNAIDGPPMPVPRPDSIGRNTYFGHGEYAQVPSYEQMGLGPNPDPRVVAIARQNNWADMNNPATDEYTPTNDTVVTPDNPAGMIVPRIDEHTSIVGPPQNEDVSKLPAQHLAQKNDAMYELNGHHDTILDQLIAKRASGRATKADVMRFLDLTGQKL